MRPEPVEGHPTCALSLSKGTPACALSLSKGMVAALCAGFNELSTTSVERLGDR
jgi:hypothetical protein